MEQLDQQVVALTKAIRQAESNGNFQARSKDGSFGAYQFIKPTWDSTAKKYGVNVQWDKATPAQQNEVAYKQIKEWKDKGFNVGQIASMWNAGAGKPNAYLQGLKGVNSAGVAYDTPAYAKKVATFYQQFKGQTQSQEVAAEPTIAEQKAQLVAQGQPVSVRDDRVQPTLGGSILRGFIKPFVRGINTVAQPISEALGNQVSYNTKYLGNVAGAGMRENQTPLQRIKDIAGVGAEIASNFIPVGKAGQIAGNVGKGLIRESVKEAGVVGLKAGGLQGIGSALQEDKTLGEAVVQGAIGSLAGGILGGVTGGIGGAIGKAKSFVSPTVDDFSRARDTIINSYKKSLPLTPTQLAKEESLLANKGENIFTTLVDNGINLGSKDAPRQIQEVSDMYAAITKEAQKNETAYFNLNEVIKNAERHIDENVSSETGRITAKNKIKKEMKALFASNKDSFIRDVDGNIKVNSNLIERLRKTGNSWTNYNLADPEKIGQSTGYALSNAVRDQVEKEGTFASYRAANKAWSNIIHAQEVLNKIEMGQKKFKVPGGLSGSIARKVLSGALGFHTGGLGGAVIAEMGSEYGAKLMANPELKTYFYRKLLEKSGRSKTPEVVSNLAKEIKAFIDTQEGVLKLPTSGSSSAPIITPPPTTYEAPAQVINNAQSRVVENAPITMQTTINKNAPISKTIPQAKTKSNSLSTLEAEARKYKSAEEFVKAQGKPLYHGSKSEIVGNLKPGVGGSRGAGIYVTPLKEQAGGYGKVNEVFISKNAKTFDYSKMTPKEIGNDIKKYLDTKNVPYEDNNGFITSKLVNFDTYSKSKQSLNTALKNTGKEDFFKTLGYDVIKFGDGESQILVVNPKFIVTKKQLVDIFNSKN